ncbi:ABC transporter permease [Streptomyces hydrogenans]|uniref:ABC transporter permease n=1 Tax=Streptomyces hydrogenans TaxID=1873719 RepID=UPI00332C414E
MTELVEPRALPETAAQAPPRPGRHRLRALLRRPRLLVCGTLVMLVLLLAAFPSLFTRVDAHDPALCELRDALAPPSAAHWFGTDALGCDYYAQVVHGAQASVTIGLVVTGATFLISMVIGALVGYLGGWVDAIVSRLCDVMFGLPFILGAIVVLQLFDGRSVATVCLALTLFYWPSGVRYMRSAVMGVRSREYVQAARVLGGSNLFVVRSHVIPNSLTPLIVLKTIGLGGVIAAEASLTFIGAGLTPPSISWGLQLAAAKLEISTHPHLLVFPSIFLSVTVLAFVLFGEAVRDALDPKTR